MSIFSYANICQFFWYLPERIQQLNNSLFICLFFSVISGFFVALVLVATIFDGVYKMRTASNDVGQMDSFMPTSEVTGKRNAAYELTDMESHKGISTAGPDGQAATPTSTTDSNSQPSKYL